METNIKLINRINNTVLPEYSKAEEIMNTISHIFGVLLGIVFLILLSRKNDWSLNVYGITIIILYLVSSIYHGLTNTFFKKIFRIVDHLTIPLLVTGTYTPIIIAMMNVNFEQALFLFIFQWGLLIFNTIINLINMKKFHILSMLCYLLMGWSVIFFLDTAIKVLSTNGFILVLIGGLTYTLGAIIYSIGKKKPFFHTIFHLLCLIATIIQFTGVFYYLV